MGDITSIWEAAAAALERLHWAEAGAVAAGIAYVILAAREHIWCWFFGVVGSVLSIYLFYISKLYAESFLYVYYVLAGIYGWYSWRYDRGARQPLRIAVWPLWRHLIAIALGVALSLMLGFALARYTDAKMPLIDAHTTIFSFMATYMVARKILENWLYWIAIDAVSVGLYWSRELYLYALLMTAYTVIAVWGWREWRRRYVSREA
jgi:nicotinamide mononucleotide transporter